MTKLLAVSAYVAVMSLAVASEDGARLRDSSVEGFPGQTSVLAKGDCGDGACSRAAARSGDYGGAAGFSSLRRTGSNETTVTRSIAR
jgi:hypothetical protein